MVLLWPAQRVALVHWRTDRAAFVAFAGTCAIVLVCDVEYGLGGGLALGACALAWRRVHPFVSARGVRRDAVAEAARAVQVLQVSDVCLSSGQAGACECCFEVGERALMASCLSFYFIFIFIYLF